MKYLNAILELAGTINAKNCPTEEEWVQSERAVGHVLPSEFKALVSKLGSGSFGLDFYLLNPKGRGLGRFSRESLIQWRTIASALLIRVPAPFFPSPGGLLRISHLSTRMDLLLDPACDLQLCMCDLDSGELEHLEFFLDEFIYKLYTQELGGVHFDELRRSIWPLGFPFFTAEKGGRGSGQNGA